MTVWAYLGREMDWEPRTPLVDDDTVADSLARYRASWQECDAIIADCDDLDTTCVRAVWDGEPPPSMRWILVHLVEETARHAGHADILRERIDGMAGR
ncbi:MAG: DUF664 domain-containing protein [Stackebrandtia sp.]